MQMQVVCKFSMLSSTEDIMVSYHSGKKEEEKDEGGA